MLFKITRSQIFIPGCVEKKLEFCYFRVMLQVPAEASRSNQQSSSRTETNERNQEIGNFSDPTPSNLSMLTRCFNETFTDLYLRVSHLLFKLNIH